MVFTVNYFIKKFEAIPEEQWTTGESTDYLGRSCAIGHCGLDAEIINLIRLLKHDTAEINDGNNERYRQPTPKQRILAALRDVANETY